MAKQLVNPVERHVEKAVVGIAALLLLGAVAKYLIGSPNQMDLGGTRISPNTIDETLAQAAAAARERVKRAPTDEPVPELLADQFEKLLNPFSSADLSLTLPRVVPLGPEIPIIDPPERPTASQLAQVVPLAAVGETHGRTTFLWTTATAVRHLPANWVTVSARFDVKAQMNELRQKYGVLRMDVAFGAAELERRQRRADGAWSDDDWKPIPHGQPDGKSLLPPAPAIQLAQEGDATVASKTSKSDLEKFVNVLRVPLVQRDLLRPLVAPQVNGDEWNFPLLTDRRDVLMQDDYYLNPDKPAAAEPLDIYRPADVREIAKPQLSKAEQIAEKFKEYQVLIDSAKKNLSEAEATRAFNLMFDIENDPEAGSADKNRAKKLKADADLVITDIRIKVRAGATASTPREGSGEVTKREPPPFQQIWCHDAAEDSVRSGTTYQYRIRAVVFNNLAGEPEKFADPAAGTEVWLKGAWSEPVEVTIGHDQRFFLTGEDKRDVAVNVEFYRWFEGVWVKSRRFKALVGDPLADSQVIEVPPPDNPTGVTRATVEFSADLTVLDVDFERALRERRRGDSRTGVKFGDPRAETAVVLVSEEGTLVERFVATDKANEERKAIPLWTPPRAP